VAFNEEEAEKVNPIHREFSTHTHSGNSQLLLSSLARLFIEKLALEVKKNMPENVAAAARSVECG
jgi:hypothetical protein